MRKTGKLSSKEESDRTDDLRSSIEEVVQNGNCSGCGGCTLLSSQIEMGISADGFLRPRIAERGRNTALISEHDVKRFRRICPGVTVKSPRSAHHHDVFGRYVAAWEAWSNDDDMRYSGSSGGVLTSLANWLVESERAPSVVACSGDDGNSGRTVPLVLTDRESALRSAGSRYAPVSTLAAFGLNGISQKSVLVAKPCEASALSGYLDEVGMELKDRPIVLSFFCAGTPSQLATDELCNQLGIAPESVSTLKYRGGGWPGNFAVETANGDRGEMTYQESWGKVLGKNLQWRCKICVDGTGADSDIAVGDYWEADENGYPKFESGEGRSVVIARTDRGREIVEAASEASIIQLLPVELDAVAEIQPLQKDRKYTLVGRLLGRGIAGKSIPRFRGYGLLRLAVSNPQNSFRALVGTIVRTRGLQESEFFKKRSRA